MSTTKTKFLLLFRFPADYLEHPSSPEEMQAQYETWTAWMAKFEKDLIPGGPLKPDGAVVRGGEVTDGPYIEAKEIIASYAFVETSSLERAIEIALECPINTEPDSCVEVREMGF